MTKTVSVEIEFSGLPTASNHNPLAVQLEEEINDAVARALAATFDDGIRGKEWRVHVPVF
jgi:hypothetical protein